MTRTRAVIFDNLLSSRSTVPAGPLLGRVPAICSGEWCDDGGDGGELDGA